MALYTPLTPVLCLLSPFFFWPSGPSVPRSVFSCLVVITLGRFSRRDLPLVVRLLCSPLKRDKRLVTLEPAFLVAGLLLPLREEGIL